MANSHRRETLSNHLLGQEARALGFPSGTEVSGDFIPRRGRFLTYYNGRVLVAPQGREPIMRKVIVLTDGQQWFVGAQDGKADTHLMLESLDKGIENGQRERHAVNGDELADVLKNPADLPEIQLLKNEKVGIKIDTRSHSFE